MTVLEHPDQPTPPKPVRRIGDRLFGGTAKGAGILILVTLAAVAIFLVTEAWPAFTNDVTGLSGHETFLEYVGPLVFGTILASVLALRDRDCRWRSPSPCS